MEKHRKYSIIMTRDGHFQKSAPLQNVNIGEEVNFKPMKSKRISLRTPSWNSWMAIAACMVLFFVIYFSWASPNTTYAYITIDINPSLELAIDEEMNVQSVTPLNDDAKQIQKELEDYHKVSLKEVINTIIMKSETQNLLENGKNMLIGISYDSTDLETNDELLENVEHYVKQEIDDWQVATFHVPKKVRQLAKEERKSMNELMASSFSENEEEVNREEHYIDKQEEAIINSFYNQDEEKTNKEDKQEKVVPKDRSESDIIMSSNKKDQSNGNSNQGKAKSLNNQSTNGKQPPHVLEKKQHKENSKNDQAHPSKNKDTKQKKDKKSNGKSNNGKEKSNNGKGHLKKKEKQNNSKVHGKSKEKPNNGNGH